MLDYANIYQIYDAVLAKGRGAIIVKRTSRMLSESYPFVPPVKMKPVLQVTVSGLDATGVPGSQNSTAVQVQ
jgi:hypothetical protein